MTLEEIKKSIECHYDYKCEICPNNEELGSGEIVCISRLLPEIIDCINNLQSQLAEKEKAIENWQTMYESVVQTCHNDKEEIERLNKRLETQENIITNLVEDNRASQEWYRKQLVEKDKEIEYQESTKILAVENQNKKAIEQLEQIINLFEPYENEEKDTILCANNGISFLEYIDNQIEQLTHQHEDKGE